MKLGEAIYKAQQAGAGRRRPAPARRRRRRRAGQGQASGDEKVVDADFEEVDDDKKKSA